MHVKTKQVAFSGVLLALNVVLIYLSDLIPVNTLWLLALSAFLTGIIIREFKLLTGGCFLVAAVILSLLFIPNKIHGLTFAFMGAYILVYEAMWPMAHKLSLKVKINVYLIRWIGSVIFFNLGLIPVLIFFPSLFITVRPQGWMLLVIWLGAMVVREIYDRAYRYFQEVIWHQLRKRLGMDRIDE